ncbi:hypothetical protein AD006_29115 (plasmid) [Pseudonocardia sp. EC080610-09]|nr:hypothetical protein AD006_29115 [Pseudonocardia sp. EC080610-09]ALL85322.1 hypothetical protein AD017_29505 [Pseudonocardia sp. EC080619-01]
MVDQAVDHGRGDDVVGERLAPPHETPKPSELDVFVAVGRFPFVAGLVLVGLMTVWPPRSRR